MNQIPWENNREDTWTKYKGRVAKWPSGQDHVIITISGQWLGMRRVWTGGHSDKWGTVATSEGRIAMGVGW